MHLLVIVCKYMFHSSGIRSDCNFQCKREWAWDETWDTVFCCALHIVALTLSHNNLGNVIYSYHNPCNTLTITTSIHNYMHVRSQFTLMRCAFFFSFSTLLHFTGLLLSSRLLKSESIFDTVILFTYLKLWSQIISFVWLLPQICHYSIT